MYKLFLSLVISSGISFASMINGIAITVNDEPITIYDIEKTVETYLMDKNKEIAREYIGYRRSRTSARNKSSELVKKIQGLFDGSDESITAENANKDATKIHVQRDLLAGIVAKDVVKDLHMIPRKVEEYCDKNILHFHK